MVKFSPTYTADFSAKLTLLTLLFTQVGNSFTRPTIMSLAALGLLSNSLRQKALLWLSLFCLLSFRIVDQWPMADNHAYLLAIWCLALFIYFYNHSTHRILVNNARLLIGLVFLLASFQKMSADDYLNGTFFRYLFLTDERFEDFAILFGNISYQQIDDARKTLGVYQFSPTLPHGEIVPLSAEFHRLVIFSTWWNLVDQMIVACCFLSPINSIVSKKRDIVLVIFCLTTFAVAPVPGFAWLLISMAIAQCEPKPKIHIAYLTTFFLILFYYQIHWTKLLVDFFQWG